MKSQIDLIIHSKFVIPVIPENMVLQDYSLAIDKGRIVAIGPTKEIQSNWHPKEEEFLQNHLLLPGFINCDAQITQNLLKILQINESVAPEHGSIKNIQDSILDENFVFDACVVGIHELVRKGITCFGHNVIFPEAMISAAKSIGIKLQVGLVLQNKKSNYAKEFGDYLRLGLSIRDKYKDLSTLKFAFSIDQNDLVKSEQLSITTKYANELEMPINIVFHNNADVKFVVDSLESAGVLNEQTQLSGIESITDDLCCTLKRYNCKVLHTPLTTRYPDEYFKTLFQLEGNNPNFSFATANTNKFSTLDVFELMKVTGILARINLSPDSNLLAHQLIRMATINGARTFGWESQIGSLEQGKDADIIAINLDQMPRFSLDQLPERIFFSEIEKKISHSWSKGENLMRDQSVNRIPVSTVNTIVERWLNNKE
ncbi:MAG: N-ethylammeline chlorohydrolase [Porticoccaceae bacterium]|nr:MAG: N-ethylammeline chlorohydrolase [Porticoccaceae bacterium]